MTRNFLWLQVLIICYFLFYLNVLATIVIGNVTYSYGNGNKFRLC